MSIGEYLFSRIFEIQMVSASMASGTGLFNPRLKEWDKEVLDRLRIDPDALSPLARDRECVVGLRGAYAVRWPLLSNIPWALPMGDGAASNIGSGCVTADKIAINVGTSGAMRVCFRGSNVELPRGLWMYLADREHVLIGGALSNGGDVYAWCQRTLRLEAGADIRESESRAIDAHGLTALPFFSGERSTGWADQARAAIAGMSLTTTPLDILEVMLESVSFRFAAIFDLLKPELGSDACIVASGAAILKSTYWPQMMADVIGVPVITSLAPEASSRGAAIFALAQSGNIESFESIPGPLGTTYKPRMERHARYKKARARQERLYGLLVEQGHGDLRE